MIFWFTLQIKSLYIPPHLLLEKSRQKKANIF
jgi:hypothetical protein